MPLNKNKEARFRILNECLRDSTKKYGYGSLLGEVNRQLLLMDLQPVSERTLKYDLSEMRDRFGVELDEDLMSRTPKVLRYADLSDSIFKLSPEEANALQKTIELLLDYPEPRPIQFDYIRVCLQQIAKNRKLDAENPSVAFSDNLDHKGRGFFEVIDRYIIERVPMRLEYQSYYGESVEISVSPYLLKQYNERWFLLGTEYGRTDVSVFALDRIQSVSNTEQPFQNCPENLDARFEEIVGVSYNPLQPIEPVVLKVKVTRYPYIETKPIHASQKLLSKLSGDDYKTIELSLRPNRELETLILSFGEDIEVASPEWLRERIAKRVLDMSGLYSKRKGVQKSCTLES